MSLRIRLSLIISLLFLSSMLLGVVLLVVSAKQRVTNEVSSTATLTFQLLDALLPLAEEAGTEADYSDLLRKLRELENARHMVVSIEHRGGQQAAPTDPEPAVAPQWFTRLVQDTPLEYRRTLASPAGEVITIRTNPADEISEVWQETRRFLIVLSLALLLLNSILYLVIGHWFRPVTTILANLDHVEEGGSGAPLPARTLPELQVIADRIGHLATVLANSRKDNERLQRRSLAIQEEERRHLVQELHDEMGQSISAIKAIAFSIAERNEADAMSSEGARRVVQISNNVRDHIRSMMHRLRPPVLDELGLQAALEHMVDEWNRNHSSCFCSLRCTGDIVGIGSEQQIHLYRIVQEALTNVAAHAGCEHVNLSLQCDSAIHLQIRDDGVGFSPQTVQLGMGLSGMQERVKAMGGSWQLDSAPGAGVTMEITVPLD
jgi:two-component system sensor histidine kinase UhpB